MKKKDDDKNTHNNKNDKVSKTTLYNLKEK